MLRPLSGPPKFEPYVYADVTTVFDIFQYGELLIFDRKDRRSEAQPAGFLTWYMVVP